MSRNRIFSRRQFLGTAAAAAAAPMIVPSSVFGRQGTAPNSRINIATVGVGGMGNSHVDSFLKQEGCQIVAVCDVDKGRKPKGSSAGYGQGPTKEKIEKYYGDKLKGEYKGCATYTDYREVCARKDVDAISIATPDHWHALVAMEALKNGKDVYCEKPVVHLWGEGKALVDALKGKDRIWQTGSQQRSSWEFRRAVEIVRNGLVGKVKTVEVGLPKGHSEPQGDAKPSDPPESLNYDFWCGPSEKLAFVPGRVHFHWRWNLAFGGGQLMDWIGHHNDITHWALDMDSSGPIEVEAGLFDYPADKTLYDAPVNYEVKCTYAGGITTSISNKHPMGMKVTGDAGWVHVTRGPVTASNPEWVKKEFNPGAWKAAPSDNHQRNFLESIRSRKPTICPMETSFRSITPGFLGYLAHDLGRKVKWDPKEMKVVGDDEAQKKLATVAYRGDWKL